MRAYAVRLLRLRRIEFSVHTGARSLGIPPLPDRIDFANSQQVLRQHGGAVGLCRSCFSMAGTDAKGDPAALQRLNFGALQPACPLPHRSEDDPEHKKLPQDMIWTLLSAKWRDLDSGPRSLTQGGNHEPKRSSFSARTNRIDEVSA
jgi:hypothetical protein